MLWYYICCKPLSFPGLFSDVLGTLPGSLTQVGEQALDSAGQLGWFSAGLLGGYWCTLVQMKHQGWAALEALAAVRPARPQPRHCPRFGLLRSGAFLVKRFSKT